MGAHVESKPRPHASLKFYTVQCSCELFLSASSSSMDIPDQATNIAWRVVVSTLSYYSLRLHFAAIIMSSVFASYPDLSPNSTQEKAWVRGSGQCSVINQNQKFLVQL